MWRSLAQMRTTANICYSNIYELCMANCAMEKCFARFPQFDRSHAPRLEAMRICSRSQHCSHCSVCFNAGTAMRNPTIGHVGNSIWGLLELADRTRKEMLLNIEYPWISLIFKEIYGNLSCTNSGADVPFVQRHRPGAAPIRSGTEGIPGGGDWMRLGREGIYINILWCLSWS